MQRRSKRLPGFTVTELLVVIAIMLVLAALIVASVGRAREAAYASVCMSNMKQVAAQQIALCIENNGVIVHATQTQINGTGPRPWPLYQAILQSDTVGWSASWREASDEVELLDYMMCPTAYREKRSELDKLNGWAKVSSYAMNGIIGSDYDPDSGEFPWIRGARSIGDIENAGTLVMCIEKEWAPWGQYGNGAGPVAKVHVFAEFHNGGFNVAFYDGHVERGKHGEFPIWTKKGFKYNDEEFYSYWLGIPKP